MERKTSVHAAVNAIAREVLLFINDTARADAGGWVARADICDALDLHYPATPKNGHRRVDDGELFAVIARLLEDKELLEYRNDGDRAYYRVRKDLPAQRLADFSELWYPEYLEDWEDARLIESRRREQKPGDTVSIGELMQEYGMAD